MVELGQKSWEAGKITESPDGITENMYCLGLSSGSTSFKSGEVGKREAQKYLATGKTQIPTPQKRSQALIL